MLRGAEHLISWTNFYDPSFLHYGNSGGELRDYRKTVGNKNQGQREFALQAS
jgi:hypothetical protein